MFASEMARYPIALKPDDANAQHYELPPAFFAHILGPRRKYSCCLYDGATTTLADAEERALAETAVHAGLEDGQRVLELGCGWGSLRLWMAERFPDRTILAVSNSRPQRAHIEAEAAGAGWAMCRADGRHECVRDGRAVRSRGVGGDVRAYLQLARAARAGAWLAGPARLLFLHVFSHRAMPYRFDRDDKSDWIAQHFFTGGVMPSHGLIWELDELFVVEADWRWNGAHYRRTAEHWLENFDANSAAIDGILRQVYGGDAALWARRWRLFFFATAGLFGARNGTEWGISHYALRPR